MRAMVIVRNLKGHAETDLVFYALRKIPLEGGIQYSGIPVAQASI